MNKNTILHLIPKSDGGIKKHLITILTKTIELDIQHLVAGPEDFSLAKELKNLQIPYLPLHIHLDYQYLLLIKQLKHIYENNLIDVIHMHGHKMSIAGRLANLSTKRNIKEIVTIHNFTPNNFYGELLKNINKFLDFKTNKIIAVSKALYKRQVFPKNYYKTSVIYNGIDLTRFQSYHPHMQNDKVKIIGTVARLAPQKGLEFLLKAFKKVLYDFPGLNLYIVGGGPEKIRLQQLACHLQIKNQVIFTDHVIDVLDHLKKIDLFIMPSLSEGLSIATLEALALKKPVIASNTGGLAEVIEHDVSGLLIKPGCVDSLASSIKFLILNREQRIKLSENARNRVEQLFTVEQMIAKTKKIYMEIK